MNFIRDAFKNETVKKILVLIGIAIIIYLGRSMLNLFLLTFLLTYLMNSFEVYISNLITKYLKIKIKHGLLTITIYCIFIVVIVLLVYKYVPILISQGIEIINEFSNFKLDVDDNGILEYFVPALEGIDIKGYIVSGANHLIQLATNVGKWSFNVFIAIMLSMFYMLEKNKVKDFVKRFDKSKISFVYRYMREFGKNFLNSFGKVIQAQILIAFVNSILSVIALSIMGFPQLLGLGVMIFIFSLIPVAGTMISLVPLCIIAFNIGGMLKVIYVLIMIALLHALESYILNPRLMSAKTDLPVFLTFIILIVSEHFMGIWGLLLGIPLFMFLMDLLEVK